MDELSFLNGTGHWLTGYFIPDVSGLCNRLILLDFRPLKMRPLICLKNSKTEHPATLHPVPELILKPVFSPVDRKTLNFFNNPYSKRFGVQRYIDFCKRTELYNEIISYLYNIKFLTAKIDTIF